MPSVQDIDQIASSKNMDIMAVNVYHGSQDNLTGDEIAFAGDFFRSVKNEKLPDHRNQRTNHRLGFKIAMPPYDGQLRMNVYAHMGSGANMVEYWHWHSIHYGQETTGREFCRTIFNPSWRTPNIRKLLTSCKSLAKNWLT